MIEAAGPVPVTVKCRIGVDEQDPEAVLPAFLATMAAAGVRRVAIHARKAWLEGLSPKQNREIPPLDHAPGGADEGGVPAPRRSSSTAASTTSTRPRASSRAGSTA